MHLCIFWVVRFAADAFMCMNIFSEPLDEPATRKLADSDVNAVFHTINNNFTSETMLIMTIKVIHESYKNELCERMLTTPAKRWRRDRSKRKQVHKHTRLIFEGKFPSASKSKLMRSPERKDHRTTLSRFLGISYEHLDAVFLELPRRCSFIGKR